ncbi:hypothetical protein GWO43_15185, partial [candidate division KSB1 bacterium]|nr:hypothetical protein [candidate division KSB1 bacterium]NIT72189.1 hypothetical protein [candidate division KSB1 bacterium]NIX71869.1 hypothetical protein [candidate division KSB1 bacterium]
MSEKPTPETNEKQTGRRSFLKKLSFTTIALGMLGQLGAWVRSLIPNILYEPPMRIKIGNPDDFVDGMQFLED